VNWMRKVQSSSRFLLNDVSFPSCR
jgi:hypothetical protein